MLTSRVCEGTSRTAEAGVAIERVLLWGFMASGKTAVGARLAERLGWEHVDLDEEIVRRAGKPVARIFREDGEAVFRALEAAATRELLSRVRAVLSPGGGWVMNPGVVDSIPEDTLTVWLRVAPDTVLDRLRSDPGGPERPLLATSDPAERIRSLLAQREAAYGRADYTIPTDDRSIESIVAEIESLVRPTLSVSHSRSESPDG